MKLITTLFFLFFSIQSMAQALDDIQYVTGKLYLSLYEQADAGSKVLKSLVSGDRVDVIEIAGPYAKVILDSGKEGWVKKGFLVKDKPARILYRESNEAYENLLKDMKTLEEKNSNIKEIEEKILQLTNENKQLANKNKLLESQLNINTDKNNSNLDTSENLNNGIELDVFKQFIEEYLFFLIASLIAFVLIGFRVGELKKETEVIKHFGGVKVW